MAGHHDVPSELDVAWFSDDNGASWKLSNISGVPSERSAAASQPVVWPKQNEFLGFDEPQFTELRNGSVLLSMRRDASGQRGQALSSDGGRTFSWSTPTIPNHAGGVQQPLITLSNGTLAYAAPNADGRSNMTVFISADDANSWSIARNVYSGPSAYSALGEKSNGALLLAYERDVAECSGESCAIEWVVL
jgi:sialidase-1